MTIINNVGAFRLAYGGRPNLYTPGAQWLIGTDRCPFRVGCTLKNAAVTDSELQSQDVWYEDTQVRAAYTPSNGSSTRLRSLLTVEAARVLVMSSVFSALDATVKDDVSAQLFLTFDIGGQRKYIDLRGCVREPAKEFQKTQATATLADWWLLHGSWAVIPGSPITLDLEQDTFKLESLNSVAYGADITQCWVELVGFMVPKNAPGGSTFIPGNCPPPSMNSRGELIPGVIADPRQVIDFARGPLTISRQPGA